MNRLFRFDQLETALRRTWGSKVGATLHLERLNVSPDRPKCSRPRWRQSCECSSNPSTGSGAWPMGVDCPRRDDGTVTASLRRYRCGPAARYMGVGKSSLRRTTPTRSRPQEPLTGPHALEPVCHPRARSPATSVVAFPRAPSHPMTLGTNRIMTKKEVEGEEHPSREPGFVATGGCQVDPGPRREALIWVKCPGLRPNSKWRRAAVMSSPGTNESLVGGWTMTVWSIPSGPCPATQKGRRTLAPPATAPCATRRHRGEQPIRSWRWPLPPRPCARRSHS